MIKRVLTVAALLVGAVYGFEEVEYKDAFVAWMHKHEKIYDVEAFQTRYAHFKVNMDKVHACNNNPEFTFDCELNKFSDLHFEEFKRLYTGFDHTLAQVEPARPFVELDQVDFNATSGGDAINWAAKGAVTSPKNQGSCGSCWSFSVTGALEGLNQIFTNSLISLSEQNLVDCVTNGANGCNGGDPRSAFQYVINNRGIDKEASYGYEMGNYQSGQDTRHQCRFNYANTGAVSKRYVAINQGDENDLTNHIIYQPVAITVDVTDNFQSYRSGIFNDGSCGNAINQLDHAILAIGYGNQGGDYYIVKNSWGTNWGMGGYIWMARNRGNMCGIATYATAPGN